MTGRCRLTPIASCCNAYTTDSQDYPTLGLADDGSMLTFWSSYGEFGGGYQIAGRRLASDGTPLGADFQATSAFYGATFTAAAVNGSGEAVLTWIDGPDPTLRGDVYAR